MNSLREFASWCPDVDPLDAESSDRIWAEIVGPTQDTLEPEATSSARRPIGDRMIEPPMSGGHLPRRAVAIAAAVLLVAGVGAVAALQLRGEPDPVFDSPSATSAPVATLPEDAARPDVEPAPEWESFPSMPIAPRFQQAAVSTGDGLFVWGGCCADDVQEPYIDGAYYDGTDWRVVPEAPLDPSRGDAVAAWTGSEVIVLNGVEGVTAAAFDPESFSWRPLIAPPADAANSAGSRLFALGSDRLALARPEAVYTYEISADRWSEAAVNADGGDASGQTVWGYAASDPFVAMLTSPDMGDACGSDVTLRSYDTTTGSWWSHGIHTSDFEPVDLAALPDGRLLALGRSCGAGPTDTAAGIALAIEPVTGTATRLADPPDMRLVDRYGALTVNDTVIYLGVHHSALLGYRLADDEWTLGAPLVRTSSDSVDETPLMALGDDRVVIVSPGYTSEQTGGSTWCCQVRDEAWVNSLPNVPFSAEPIGGPESTPETDRPDAANPTVPAAVDSDTSVKPDEPVIVANASGIAGIAGVTTDSLRLSGYDVLEPVNAATSVGDLDKSIVYSRPGHEALGEEVAARLGIDATAEIDPQTPLAIDGTDIDHDRVAVLVMLGRDFTLAAGVGDGVSVGEQLYTVVAGDTVGSIAARFGIPNDHLVAYNEWASADVRLSPGDIVRIPPGAIIPRRD